jgi:DNA-binding response OmpR family regulator
MNGAAAREFSAVGSGVPLARILHRLPAMRTSSRARVLVVEDVETEARLLMRALADAGYSNLVHRPSVESAITEIESNPPRLVITDLHLDGTSGVELTKYIRRLDPSSYIYVLMLTAAAGEAVLESCFDAGVDDFVEKPFRGAEIVARMHAGERILELETTLRAKSRELETALRRIDIAATQRALARAADAVATTPAAGATPLDALLGTSTWRDVDQLLTTAMTDFFQLPFAPIRTGAKPREPFVAEISLSEPSKQLELALSIVIETHDMKRLGVHLLGDEDVEGAQALVLEVANILMGTLKTAFTSHGFTFTGGIPTSETFEQSRATFDRSMVRSRMALGASDSALELWLRIKEKSNTTIRGRLLREGLVVTEDIRDAQGTLLAKGGSRLTHTTAERIAKLLPDVEVTVSDPSV